MTIDNMILDLRKLFDRYIEDELSLLDLDYLDECFDDLIQALYDKRNKIIQDRFAAVLDDIYKTLF